MSTFGIRTEEFGDGDEHYIGEDEVLLEWLLANNYEPCEHESRYLVKAPVGYEFYKGALLPKSSPELEGVSEKDIRDSAYVSFGSPENDKALMLLEGAMTHLEAAEFDALGLDEERILDYHIY